MPDSSEHNSSASCVQSLRLSDNEFDKLIIELDKQAEAVDTGIADARVWKRVQYRKSVKFIIDVEHPGGSTARYAVRSRNISTGGIGLLHGGYVYPDSSCEVLLPRLDGRWERIPARIAWARSVKGTIHEVGVEFEEQVDIRNFVEEAELNANEDDSNQPDDKKRDDVFL